MKSKEEIYTKYVKEKMFVYSGKHVNFIGIMLFSF
jgi:hypothetical protein